MSQKEIQISMKGTKGAIKGHETGGKYYPSVNLFGIWILGFIWDLVVFDFGISIISKNENKVAR